MSDGGAIRVLIAEDDPAVRSALSDLISAEPGLELARAVADATEAVVVAALEHPDVAVVDVRMPGGGGVTAARGIRRRSPATRVLALTGQSDHTTVLQMLEAGVVGYLLKGEPVEAIVRAIREAASGRGALSSAVAGDVISELAGELSARSEREERHHAVEDRIGRALSDDAALSMVFQPIVRLGDGETVGAESLARFAGPPQRSPSLWFAEAAIVGRRQQLEVLAARKAVAGLAQLPDGRFLTINVSPSTLISSDFQSLVSEVDGSRIVVEITEHAPIEDYTRLDSALVALREDGVRLAIDDAGAGYSSLRHILELKPELIKLDLSLIRGIHDDLSKQALAAGIISFAEKIGTSIVAEGIERSAELETLVELGVDTGQGYLLGRPGPLPLAA